VVPRGDALGLAAAALAAAALAGCGAGGSSSPPLAPSGTRSETFAGSTEIASGGTCRNGGHPFETGDGTVEITLVQSAGSVALNVQLCHPSATDHRECSIPPFARVDVGMTLRAAVRGGRSQVLTVYPSGCGTGSPAATGPISYTVSVVHPG
jgi:hypothetical protein